MTLKKSAAFFDLDRTLMAGSSGFYFVRSAYRIGFITRKQLAGDAYTNIVFRLRGSTDQLADESMERLLSAVEGVNHSDLQRLTPSVLAGVLPSLYPQVLDVAYAHQDAGRKVYICTAALNELAVVLAQVLGFDGGIGTQLEVVQGKCTGKLAGPFIYRDGKPQAIRELADREGIDLASSYAYSDSESDLPMLRAVGHPVAVNPDADLAKIAQAEGWEVFCFDQLGRRLRIAAAAVGMAAVGGIGGTFVARHGKTDLLIQQVLHRRRKTRSSHLQRLTQPISGLRSTGS